MENLDPEFELQVSQLFGRHVVAFTWWEGVPSSNGRYKEKPKFNIASGFVMELFDTWWLVTAGHVFEDFRKRQTKEGIKSFDHLIWDFFGDPSSSRFAIPWDFFDEDNFVHYMFDEDAGIDFALLHIPYLVQKSLEQTIFPFRKSDWVDRSDDEYDKYLVCGLPGELGSIVEWEEGDGISALTALALAVLHVDAIKEPCDKVEPTKFPQFVGQLTTADNVKDIRGMSGGPIIGMKKLANGEVRYYPIAIQSRWLSKSRIVIGTYIELIGKAMEAVLERDQREWEESHKESEVT